MCSSHCLGPRKALRGRSQGPLPFALIHNKTREELGFKAQLSWWEGTSGRATLELLGATLVEPLNFEHAVGRAGPPRPGDLGSDTNQTMLSLRAEASGGLCWDGSQEGGSPATGPIPVGAPAQSPPSHVGLWVLAQSPGSPCGSCLARGIQPLKPY